MLLFSCGFPQIIKNWHFKNVVIGAFKHTPPASHSHTHTHQSAQEITMPASNQNSVQLLVHPDSVHHRFPNPWQWAKSVFLSLPVLQKRIIHQLQPLLCKSTGKPPSSWQHTAENSTLTGIQEVTPLSEKIGGCLCHLVLFLLAKHYI